MQPKPVVLPLEDLQLVPLPVAKDEKARGERIQCEAFLYQYCQPVDRFAQVRATAGQIYLLVLSLFQHWALSVLTTSKSRFRSKPGRTSTVAWSTLITKGGVEDFQIKFRAPGRCALPAGPKGCYPGRPFVSQFCQPCFRHGDTLLSLVLLRRVSHKEGLRARWGYLTLTSKSSSKTVEGGCCPPGGCCDIRGGCRENLYRYLLMLRLQRVQCEIVCNLSTASTIDKFIFKQWNDVIT